MIFDIRFFTKKMFGVLIDGQITKVKNGVITIKAEYWGNKWTEKIPQSEDVYYPRGHEKQGEVIPKEEYMPGK